MGAHSTGMYRRKGMGFQRGEAARHSLAATSAPGTTRPAEGGHMEEKEKIDWSAAPADILALAELLGEGPAERLIEAFGGETLYIPKRETLVRASRDKMIRKQYFDGENRRVLARTYHLSERQLRRIISSLPSNPAPAQGAAQAAKKEGPSTE
ncbi:hypothetical protein D7X33_05740 [Butyricicoccus sp. 1XD8-22]|nr:hypothetical protein D7X33_05740 [Butyricicoccus sp. 1XD8-22]